MRKQLTKQEYEALKPYEVNMRTALKSDWTRGLGRTGIQTMKEIRDAVTGKRVAVNMSCPVCVMHLVRDVARLYFSYDDGENEIMPFYRVVRKTVGKIQETPAENKPADDGFTVEEVTLEAPDPVGTDETAEPANTDEAGGAPDDGFTVEEIVVGAPEPVGTEEATEPAAPVAKKTKKAKKED